MSLELLLFLSHEIVSKKDSIKIHRLRNVNLHLNDGKISTDNLNSMKIELLEFKCKIEHLKIYIKKLDNEIDKHLNQ